jgi:hypothetical protein
MPYCTLWLAGHAWAGRLATPPRRAAPPKVARPPAGRSELRAISLNHLIGATNSIVCVMFLALSLSRQKLSNALTVSVCLGGRTIKVCNC